ncbi:MAG TPA: coenzyme F420-0:L-glutamate ligase [Xanthobacteraceae bacterium]|nr:coenzyme F420-0:L-glutamate ligase [Xanthobacteraceae bacterium]
MSPSLTLVPLADVPLVRPGDDLADILAAAFERSVPAPAENDVLVVAQKIVSKAEGRYLDLADVQPSARALALAAEVQKDARLVEVILRESRRVVRHRPNVLIVEHRLGFVMANAGVDHSNSDPTLGEDIVLLLPENPDGAAQALHQRLSARFGRNIAVIINDSWGRPWRRGTVGVALGSAGLPALLDLRGRPDLFGRALRVSELGLADEIAAAASLLMGQANEGRPAVLVRGLSWAGPPSRASDLIRPAEEDLFR